MAALAKLRTMTLNGQSRDVSIMPTAVVLSYIPSQCYHGPIRTSPLPSFAIKIICPDIVESFASLAMRNIHAASYLVITTFASLSLRLGSCVRFSTAITGTKVEL